MSMQIISQEVWKLVAGYEDFYEVSNYGRVRSFSRKVKTKDKCNVWSVRRIDGRVLAKTITTNGKGYLTVECCVESKRKRYLIHRLVAYAFIDNHDNKPEINHKDGNPKNNYVDNLEWCTRKENMEHASKAGLLPKGLSGPGMQSPASKLNDDDVRQIKIRLRNGESAKVISGKYPVGESAICEIKAGRSWSHIG